MSTTWTNENLNDYLDDRLSPTERTELETIIRKDAVAIEALRELRRLRISLRKAPRFKLNNNFAARVVAGLKQGDDQPRVAAIDETSSIVSVASPPTPAHVSSISASTWRTIAITMTAIAASLLLILIIRPDLSGSDNLAQLPDAPRIGMSNIDSVESSGNNGVEADSGTRIANTLAPGNGGAGAGPESLTIQPPNDSEDRQEELGEPMTPGGAVSPDDGEPSAAPEIADSNDAAPPGMPSPEVSVDSEPKESAEYAVTKADATPRMRADIAEADINDVKVGPAGQFVEDLSPFRFDEVVFVATTQDRIDTMVSVLDVELNPGNSALALENSLPDSAFHLKTQIGLEGSNNPDADDQGPGSDAPVPQTSLEADHSTVVMSVQATTEQLDDFLTQFGAPALRIVEPTPMQKMSVTAINDLLTLSQSMPNTTAEKGAETDPGVEVLEKDSAGMIAITLLDAGVLLQKQSIMDQTRPKPAPPAKVEAPSTPVVRRYLIVFKTTEPETLESPK